MTDQTTRAYAEATHKVATEANAIATQNQTELRSLVEELRRQIKQGRWLVSSVFIHPEGWFEARDKWMEETK